MRCSKPGTRQVVIIVTDHSTRKALGMNNNSTIRDRTERRRMGKIKAVSKSSPRQRRVVVDSDDEEDDSKFRHTTSYIRHSFLTRISTIGSLLTIRGEDWQEKAIRDPAS
jgi:hypothetical protein